MSDSHSLFKALESIGFSYDTITTFETTPPLEVYGIPVGGSTTVGIRYTWSVTNPSSVEASFSREGLGKKLVKLFKKELQVGDKGFDDVVYIATSSQRKTSAFLADERTRATVADIVSEGGSIIIESERVLYSISGEPTEAQLLAMGYLIGRVADIELPQ